MSRYYHTSQRIVLEPYLATNPRAVAGGMSLSTTRVVDARPTTEYGCNTVARLVTLPGTSYKDHTDIWYDRTDIGHLFLESGVLEGVVERPSDGVDTSHLLDDINQRYQLHLIPDDIVVTPLSFTDDHVILQMAPGSVAWIGTLTLRYITVMDYPHRITRTKTRITRDGNVRMIKRYVQEPEE